MLRQHYEAYLSADESQRLSSLAAAMQWMDSAIKHIAYKNKEQFIAKEGKIVPKDPALAKKWDVALKLRIKGVNAGSSANEKEQSFRMALKRYEELVTELGRYHIQSITKYSDILGAKIGKLQFKQDRMMGKFRSVLTLLSEALKPVNAAGETVALKVGEIGQPYQINASFTQVVFRKDYVQMLRHKLRRQGAGPVALEVIEALSKVAALEKEVDDKGTATGKFVVNVRKQLAAKDQLWKNFWSFAATAEAPRRLVRTPKVISGEPKKKREPGTAVGGGLGKKERIDGLFVKGSTRGAVYEILRDQKEHTYEEVAKKVGIPVTQAKASCGTVQWKGSMTGMYAVMLNDSAAQLTFNQTPATV